MPDETQGSAEEESQKELQGRVGEFNKELLPLLKKYDLGLGASAFVKPDGTIGSRPIIFDSRPKKEELQSADDAAQPAPDAVVEG